ncbi:MAG: hypothetical protein Kow00121_00570 [Elainellaceae cyanobacterium]
MVAVPPIVLVFDVNALSSASPTEWREFSRVGNCYIPQVVYEEMKMLFDRSPDPDLEQLAKAFSRFYATSGWKTTDASASHPTLKVASGQALTRRARVSLAVGKCAYGLAQEFANSLVVLVSNDRSLLQRLQELPSVNLCGIPGDTLLQWSRTGQRPIAVSAKFQQFKSNYQPAVKSAAQPARVNSSPRPDTPSKPNRSSSVRSSPVFLSDWLPELRSLLFALIGLAIAGYLIWLLFNLLSSEELLQRPTTQQSFLYQLHLSSHKVQT